ncbi:MAG: YbaK/EbsC family protein [Nanoarchaeota archaeon]
MDNRLKEYLQKHNIEYKTYEHPAVFTVNESKEIKTKIPGRHAKCLFLIDEKLNFYLVCLPAEKRLDTKILKKELGLRELHFASAEELKKEINLTPGSVSIFGMIYTKTVFLIIDSELWNSDFVGFHPNINTSTIILNHENLEKFYNSLKVKKEILEI